MGWDCCCHRHLAKRTGIRPTIPNRVGKRLNCNCEPSQANQANLLCVSQARATTDKAPTLSGATERPYNPAVQQLGRHKPTRRHIKESFVLAPGLQAGVESVREIFYLISAAKKLRHVFDPLFPPYLSSLILLLLYFTPSPTLFPQLSFVPILFPHF